VISNLYLTRHGSNSGLLLNEEGKKFAQTLFEKLKNVQFDFIFYELVEGNRCYETIQHFLPKLPNDQRAIGYKKKNFGVQVKDTLFKENENNALICYRRESLGAIKNIIENNALLERYKNEYNFFVHCTSKPNIYLIEEFTFLE
jgi:hypothetical protein